MFKIASEDPGALNLHYFAIIQGDSTLKTDFRKAIKPKKKKIKPILKLLPTHLKACSLHGIAKRSDDERERAEKSEISSAFLDTFSEMATDTFFHRLWLDLDSILEYFLVLKSEEMDTKKNSKSVPAKKSCAKT